MEDIVIEIGNKKRVIKLNKGLSTEQLAELSRLHRMHMKYYESQGYTPYKFDESEFDEDIAHKLNDDSKN